MFSRREGSRGETLPFTRWDIFLSVILAIALMAAVAYSAEPIGGWSLKRSLLVGATVIFVLCAAQNRKVAFGCAFALITLRMGIGVLIGPHTLAFVAGTIGAGCAAWLLLRGLE
jgi:hypothetical protein